MLKRQIKGRGRNEIFQVQCLRFCCLEELMSRPPRPNTFQNCSSSERRKLTLLKAVKLTMRPSRPRCIVESKGTFGWRNRCPWQQLFWYHGKVAVVQHWFGWMLSAMLLVDVDSRKIRENITKLIRVDFMKVGCGFHFFHGHFTICNKKFLVF